MASEYLPEFDTMPLANSPGPAGKKITDDGLPKSEFSQLAYREIKRIIKSIKQSLIVNNLNHDLIYFFCTVHTIYNDLLQIRKKLGDQAFFESNEVLFFVYYITVVRLLNEIKNSKINEDHKKNISIVAVNILADIYDSEIFDSELEKKNIKKAAIVDGLLKKIDKKLLENKDLISDEEALNRFKTIMNPEKKSLFSWFGKRPDPPPPVNPVAPSVDLAASSAAPSVDPAAPIDLLASPATPIDPALQKEAEDTLKKELEKFTDRDLILSKKQTLATSDNDNIKGIIQKINEVLEEANTKYVEAFKKAYIEEYLKPKDPKIKHTDRSKDAAIKVAASAVIPILKARKIITEPRITEIITQLEDKNLQKDIKENLRYEKQIFQREIAGIDLILQSKWLAPAAPAAAAAHAADLTFNSVVPTADASVPAAKKSLFSRFARKGGSRKKRRTTSNKTRKN